MLTTTPIGSCRVYTSLFSSVCSTFYAWQQTNDEYNLPRYIAHCCQPYISRHVVQAELGLQDLICPSCIVLDGENRPVKVGILSPAECFT